MSASDRLVAAADRMHAWVTLAQASDRATITSEVAAIDDEHELITLVLVGIDLAAYVNRRYSRALGVDEAEAWRELLLDIAEWREGLTP